MYLFTLPIRIIKLHKALFSALADSFQSHVYNEVFFSKQFGPFAKKKGNEKVNNNKDGPQVCLQTLLLG